VVECAKARQHLFRFRQSDLVLPKILRIAAQEKELLPLGVPEERRGWNGPAEHGRPVATPSLSGYNALARKPCKRAAPPRRP